MDHILNDKRHRVVSESEFLRDVNLNGYIFLYGKNKVQSFEGNPYSGHRTEFLTLEKNIYIHSRKLDFQESRNLQGNLILACNRELN